MRHSYQKNYSTALRKLTASAIGSVFELKRDNDAASMDFYRSIKSPPGGLSKYAKILTTSALKFDLKTNGMRRKTKKSKNFR